MKNQTLLRLAGFGFFGVTFLSPGSMEKKNWFTNELCASRLLSEHPFSSPPPDHQPNYSEKREETTVINMNAAALSLNKIAIAKTNTVAALTPAPDTSLPGKRRDRLSVTKVSAAQTETNSSVQFREAGVTSDFLQTDTTILIYSPAAKETVEAPSANEQADVPVPEETLLPPTEYVDEVKTIRSVKHTQLLVPIISTAPELGIDLYPEESMTNRINTLSNLSEDLGYSAKYAFLINLGLKSGKKRFFIIDLENRRVYSSGLVAHGRGNEKFTLSKKYSNRYGSSCSSLGLYKVGSAYNGSFGKSFRLLGLQKTNNNALGRAIVLHSMGCIPDEEIDYPICQSEGCPSISPSFLQEISQIIGSTTKPILLWVFDPAIDKDFSL